MTDLFKSTRMVRRFLRRLDGAWWRVIILWLLTLFLRYGLWSVLLFASIDASPAQSRGREQTPFKDGKILRYKVNWSFIRLGTVVIEQLADSSEEHSFQLRMTVKSTPSLPFINLDFVNRTLLSFERQSVSEETVMSGEDRKNITVYRYDSKRRQVYVEETEQGGTVRRDSIPTDSPCYDALGLFMLSRGLNGSGLSLLLPTLNDYAINPTEIRLTREPEEVEVDAIPFPVKCRRVVGNAKWVGKSFAGMKGSFEGWITDDEAAIPLKAEVEIFLGSVTLELESYERPGWNPLDTVLNASKH